ncbi:fimbrial biogenesis chaperone [Acinetobacter pullicarnis]|uniref:fimbrial biogenesis chaperone n=1 Tax=Acinetobacter pullicarnis TaxID=2576829 RepID=UPI00148EB974|nr:molecular chaperone [Acinetobacter pullicarnis]
MNLNLKKQIFALVSLVSAQSYAGIGLETTRIIFNQNDKNASVTAFNTDANTGFLLQSWVEGVDRKLSPDFVVTPPLMKLGQDKKNTLNISKVADLSNNNVEQLYWLNVRFIPPGKENSENVLRFSLTNQIKLIYRPEILEKVDFSKEVKKIIWTVTGDKLVVNNPTPYIINLNSINIDAQPVEEITYLLPQTETNFKLKSKASVKPKIEFSYINDYGAVVKLDVDH